MEEEEVLVAEEGVAEEGEEEATTPVVAPLAGLFTMTKTS